jgi:CelD/BcsL family acetyltransferase involved in cellulose biosynthesis
MFVLVARRRDEIVGLAPLYRYGHGLRRIRFIGQGQSDYCNFVLSREDADGAARFLWGYIVGSLGLGDLVHLADVPAGSALGRLQPSGGGFRRIGGECCPGLALPGDWETYRKTLSKSFRRKIGQDRRHLERVAGLKIARAEDGDVRRAIDELSRLHERWWTVGKRAEGGIFRWSQALAFHEEVALRFAEKGWLRTYVLSAGGRTRAVLHAFRFRDTCSAYITGHDPDPAWKNYSVVSMLFARAIEDAIREGASYFDFLRGDEWYKSRWGASFERSNVRLLAGRPSWLASLVLLRRRRPPRGRRMT